MADDRRSVLARANGATPHSIWDVKPILRANVLVVGMTAQAVNGLPRHVLAPNSRVTRVPQRLLARRHVLGVDRPDLILAPLLAASVDVMALVETLGRFRFSGRFLALAPMVPDRTLICAEMHDMAADLNLDIVTLDGPPDLHLV